MYKLLIKFTIIPLKILNFYLIQSLLVYHHDVLPVRSETSRNFVFLILLF